jgi:hypothetical protein
MVTPPFSYVFNEPKDVFMKILLFTALITLVEDSAARLAETALQ